MQSLVIMPEVHYCYAFHQHGNCQPHIVRLMTQKTCLAKRQSLAKLAMTPDVYHALIQMIPRIIH